MRRMFLVAAAVLLSALVVSPLACQTPAAPETPESLNAAYTQAMQAKDWPGALAAAQKLVDLDATADRLRLLADAQLRSGAMDTSLATYDRALAAAEQEKPAEGQPDTAWRELVGKITVGKGNAYLKLRRNPEAIAEYNQAAEIAPNPGEAYFNICAVLYNTGDMQRAPDACRKAVQADPTRANAWFVLGSVLFVTSPSDSKGNFIISAETRQALEKYLELAPNGPHAADVKAMLDMAAK